MTAPGRRRDAGRSRAALLTAAADLFAERGYERTTLRDIGERAGVDAALVARYFGSKAGLYVAGLQAELGQEAGPDLLARGRLRSLLARVDARGPGPVLLGAARPQDDPAVQTATDAELRSRLVAPLLRRLSGDAVRAELGVAAFVGVALCRAAGGMPALAAADADVVADLLHDLLGHLELDEAAPDGADPDPVGTLQP